MQVRTRSRGSELSGETRRAVERRLRLALGRHAGWIASSEVRLSRESADEAGCRIRARLRSGAIFVSEATAGEREEAVDLATRRLAQSLDRYRANLSDLGLGASSSRTSFGR